MVRVSEGRRDGGIWNLENAIGDRDVSTDGMGNEGGNRTESEHGSKRDEIDEARNVCGDSHWEEGGGDGDVDDEGRDWW